MVSPRSLGFVAPSSLSTASCSECGGSITFRDCEAVCANCGVVADCSDPFDPV